MQSAFSSVDLSGWTSCEGLKYEVSLASMTLDGFYVVFFGLDELSVNSIGISAGVGELNEHKVILHFSTVIEASVVTLMYEE